MRLLLVLMVVSQQSGVPTRAGGGAAASSGTQPPDYNVATFPTADSDRRCSVPVVGINGTSSTAYQLSYVSLNGATAPSQTNGTPWSVSARGLTQTASVNAALGISHNYFFVARGADPYIGGFVWWTRFGKDTSDNGTAQWFVGLGNTRTPVVGCGKWETSHLNGLSFRCPDGGTTVNFCANNDAGQTCVDLGAGFSCGRDAAQVDGGMFYDVGVTANPNTNSVTWWAQNLNTLERAGGVVTTNLPAPEAMLAFQLSGCTGDAGLQRLGMVITCLTNQ